VRSTWALAPAIKIDRKLKDSPHTAIFQHVCGSHLLEVRLENTIDFSLIVKHLADNCPKLRRLLFVGALKKNLQSHADVARLLTRVSHFGLIEPHVDDNNSADELECLRRIVEATAGAISVTELDLWIELKDIVDPESDPLSFIFQRLCPKLKRLGFFFSDFPKRFKQLIAMCNGIEEVHIRLDGDDVDCDLSDPRWTELISTLLQTNVGINIFMRTDNRQLTSILKDVRPAPQALELFGA
jgi:hypothetical protein